MAEKKKTVSFWDELVPIRLFKDNDKYKDDVFVSVGKESVMIKRGETVYVKRKFADILDNQERQDNKTAKMIEQQAAQFSADAKMYNI